MKISADQARIMARILERYYLYADRFMSSGFSTHPESLRNTNLFLETAEDLNLIATMYPAFSGGKSIQDGVSTRIQSSQLPDPGIKSSWMSEAVHEENMNLTKEIDEK